MESLFGYKPSKPADIDLKQQQVTQNEATPRTVQRALWAYYNCDTSTIRLRFDYDSSTIQHPTRSYVLSSNNEHVNSFPLL